MIFYILGLFFVLGIAAYVYKTYIAYNTENAALAAPIAAQITPFLNYFDSEDRYMKTRVNRVTVYDDFASMYTFRQNGMVWDFNIVNKKIATDINKCIRLHLSFHCKNELQNIWALTPKEGLDEEALAACTPIDVDLGEVLLSTFIIEGNNPAHLPQFLEEDIRQRLLDIHRNNKGVWRLQKNTLSYKEPFEMDTEKKRLEVYKIVELGFELAKRIDA